MITATLELDPADYATNDERGYDLSGCSESELTQLQAIADQLVAGAHLSRLPDELQAAYMLDEAIDREICDRE